MTAPQAPEVGRARRVLPPGLSAGGGCGAMFRLYNVLQRRARHRYIGGG